MDKQESIDRVNVLINYFKNNLTTDKHYVLEQLYSIRFEIECIDIDDKKDEKKDEKKKNNNVIVNVKELREYLNNLSDESDNWECILAKDSEGNNYSPLYAIYDYYIYIPDTTYSGNAYDIELEAEDHCLEDEEWEKIKKTHKKCLLFAPMN